MTYKPVAAHDELRDEFLNDPESRAMYEAAKLQIEVSLALKSARKNRRMTQEEVAELMHTHKPVVSRLESGDADVKHFPSLLTIAKFASAVGCHVKFSIAPNKPRTKLKARKNAG